MDRRASDRATVCSVASQRLLAVLAEPIPAMDARKDGAPPRYAAGYLCAGMTIMEM